MATGLLGHADIATTFGYAHLAEGSVFDAANRVSRDLSRCSTAADEARAAALAFLACEKGGGNPFPPSGPTLTKFAAEYVDRRSPAIGDRLLGHRRASTTNRYIHLDDATLSQGAERVAVAVERMLAAESGLR